MQKMYVPKVSTAAIGLANLFPFVLVLAFGWRIPSLLFLYWCELVVVGIFSIAQMRRARVAGPFGKSIGYQIIFFVAHYGTFCVMYRALLVRLFWAGAAFPSTFWVVIWLALAGLAFAHYVSFQRDFLVAERGRITPFVAMWLPYFREVPVHAGLLTAAWLLGAVTNTLASAAAFVLVKFVVDSVVHLVYHHTVITREAGAGLVDTAWDR